ncbi:hydantoinase B/oxoprolinase family protein [Subtercola sp. YIM 133946]|uniref:hydantoinase B/oxoprolinase family protein n=1 Tax=Subtercola sp. YIM 133946 TaxID=3118909 RepID=UPI002F953A05
MIDDVTFEVMRHRLWEINNEIGVLAARMAATPAVYETGDYNTGLLDRHGRGVFSGVGVIRMATVLDLVVASVKSTFGESIGPGDVFLTNDPFAGALHAMDVAVVAPVFVSEALVSWTGIVFHEPDVGGPTPGSWSVGATDAYQEPPLIPPQRIVLRGVLQRDIEAAFLRNSRTPEALAINLHAKIGAQELARVRISEVIEEIGIDDYVALLERILHDVRSTVREQLAVMPDGEWQVSTYIDHDGVTPAIYELKLTARKHADRLVLDFTGTSPQAPGPINCAWSGLVAGILEVLVPLFCIDLPWSHGAVAECFEIVSEPGTINNATHPAPTSMATINACQSTSDLVWQVLAMMNGWVSSRRAEVIAVGYAGANSGVSSGRLANGSPFVLSLSGLGGGGARFGHDGVDSGGNIIAPIFAIPNVERLESLSPLLWLWRRELPDSGGAGEWRGGMGVEFAVTLRPPVEQAEVTVFSTSWAVPATRGAHGGFPGGLQSNVFFSGVDVPSILAGDGFADALQAGSAHELVGAGKARLILGPGDVWLSEASGGGGFGDPRARDVQAILDDVLSGRVTAAHALTGYGVQITNGPDGPVGVRAEELSPLRELETSALSGSFFDFTDGKYQCRRCSTRFDTPTAARRSLSFAHASPVSRWSDGAGFGLAVLSCPGCTAIFRVDVHRPGSTEGDTAEHLASKGEGVA